MQNSIRLFAVLMLVTLSYSTFGQATPPGKLVHHVLIWLKNPENVNDLQKLKAGAETLRNVPTVRQLIIGTPAPVAKRPITDNSFSLSCLFYFDDVAGHDAYQVHPLHKAFVEQYSSLWQKVVVYDAQVP